MSACGTSSGERADHSRWRAVVASIRSSKPSGSGDVAPRAHPGRGEGDLVAGGHLELVAVVAVVTVGEVRPAQHELVRTGDRHDDLVAVRLLPAHPRPHVAVVGAHHPVVPDPHRAARAREAAYDVRAVVADGHHVEQHHFAVGDGEGGLEARGPVEVLPRRGDHLVGRGEQPAAVLLGAEQRGEAGGGVEARQAQPVDRPVLADQGGRAPVADQCVVLDGECHAASVADMWSAEPDGSVAARVLETLAGRGETLATAESLTGGLLSARLTDVPGASRSFVGGVVSYATRVKVSLLGVPAEVVQEHGVVSEECALAMARGVRDAARRDVGPGHHRRRRTRPAGRSGGRDGVGRGRRSRGGDGPVAGARGRPGGDPAGVVRRGPRAPRPRAGE